jgi:hypothetical protein
VPRKLDRSSARPATDPVVDEPARPSGPPIVAVVHEERASGEGALQLSVSLRMPGGRVVESRVMIAGSDLAATALVDAALTDLAIGWAAALDPALLDCPVLVVRS